MAITIHIHYRYLTCKRYCPSCVKLSQAVGLPQALPKLCIIKIHFCCTMHSSKNPQASAVLWRGRAAFRISAGSLVSKGLNRRGRTGRKGFIQSCLVTYTQRGPGSRSALCNMRLCLQCQQHPPVSIGRVRLLQTSWRLSTLGADTWDCSVEGRSRSGQVW